MDSSDKLAQLAASLIRIRRLRSSYLSSDMFSEPAWDTLLELFVADANGLRLTGRDISSRCAVAPAVMSRWLCYLSKCGLLLGDGTGNLNDLLTLSPAGLVALEAMLSEEIKSRDDMNDLSAAA